MSGEQAAQRCRGKVSASGQAHSCSGGVQPARHLHTSKDEAKSLRRAKVSETKAAELSGAGDRSVPRGADGSLTDSKTDRSVAAQSVPLWRRGVPTTVEAVTPLSLE